MVYENELWHSFLLRSQIMYNLSNCRNIISKHGALRYEGSFAGGGGILR